LSDPVFARRALAAGASGYVLKEGAEVDRRVALTAGELADEARTALRG
jgi:DNA-binding NarL/FixJ family response regulator